MVPATSHELAELLRQTELLSRKRIVKLAELLPSLSDDPQELAYALVQRGWLTSYQAEQVVDGKIRQLVLGGYHLMQPLGSGGMGQVYKAWQKRLNRLVAVKVIRPELVEKNPGAVRRFRREALAVAKLQHPNIVVIYDFDQAENTFFIVMEYVDGPDLEQMVLAGGPLPVPLACDYIRQAAMGLQHAHLAGLVHRDIKPSNLLISRPEATRVARDPLESALMSGPAWGRSFVEGLVKILDMGLARMESELETKASLTREGAMMGTPDYVSPEQARDASSADTRADIYSLGCTFYFLLARRPPFPDGTMIEKLMKHQMEMPTPIEQLRPEVPPMVRAILRRMLAKDPAQRFQQPIEVVETLADVLGVPVVSSMPPEILDPLPPLTTQAMSATPPTASATPVPRTRGETPPPEPGSLTPPPGDSADDTDRRKRNVTVVTAISLQHDGENADPAKADVAVSAARKAAVLRGHVGAVMGLAFSPDCKMLATGGLDSTVRLWGMGDPPHELAVFQDRELGEVQSIAFAPGNDFLVTGSASFNAHMWRWDWHKPPKQDRQAFEGSLAYSDAFAFSKDGQYLASAVGASIWLWSPKETPPRKKSVLRNPGADVKALVFSPDDKQLVCGDADGVIQFWKMGWLLGGRPGTPVSAHQGAVSALAYSADSAFLASAGRDHSVCVWDGSGSSIQEKKMLTGLSGAIRQMLFLPDPNLLLTVSDSGQAILWNWPTGQREHEWRLEQRLTMSLAVASDGCLVAAGSSDGTISLFDLAPE